MQSRIDRLEGLVLSLMGAGVGSITKDGKGEEASMEEDEDSESDESHDEEMIKEEPEDEVEDVRTALGFLKVDKGKSMYRADSAWAVLINEVGIGREAVQLLSFLFLNFFFKKKPNLDGCLTFNPFILVCGGQELFCYPQSCLRRFISKTAACRPVQVWKNSIPVRRGSSYVQGRNITNSAQQGGGATYSLSIGSRGLIILII